MSLPDSVLMPQDSTSATVGTPSRPPEAAGAPPIAPDRELAAREISTFLAGRRPGFLFFFGYGDGSHLEAIRALTDCPVVILDPREDVAAAVAADLPADVTICTTIGAMTAQAGRVRDLHLREVLAGAVPALRAREPALFARFAAAVRQGLVDARIRSVTSRRSATTWLRNLADNLPVLATLQPLDLLAGRFAGRPGIVIGAGPSLDNCLADLRALQGRVVICAASTALPTLACGGIVPEFVIVIEANDLRCHFEGVPHLDRVTLLPGPKGHTAHFGLPVGRNLAVAEQDNAAGDWLQAAWDCRPLPGGGSVACLAFSALHALGCDPLVLAGMDLALPDGRTHAEGSRQSSRRVRYDEATHRVEFLSEDRPATGWWPGELVEAWGGGRVPTRPVLSSYRQWFESAAETWARDRTLVNASVGGARIHGFAEVSLEQWRRGGEPAPFAAQDIMKQALAAAPAPDPAALRGAVAAELAVVADAATIAAQVERLASQALDDLVNSRRTRLPGRLRDLGNAEAALRERTRSTRLLNALLGERARALAHGEARPPQEDAAALAAWSLRQSAGIAAVVAAGAMELAAMFGPFAAGSDAAG